MEINPSGDDSEKKNKKGSEDLEDLEAERKKKMKASLEDEKKDDVEDVKMNNSSDDEKEKEKEEEEGNDDEEEPHYLRMCDSSGDELTESEVIECNKYFKQLVSSGGFDIDRCPPYFPCTLSPVRSLDDEEYRKLCRFSELAITHFNLDNDESYKFVKYVKAVYGICAGEKYYITFEAEKNPDEGPITFQALVYHGIPIRVGTERIENIRAILVRKKSNANEKDNAILLA